MSQVLDPSTAHRNPGNEEGERTIWKFPLEIIDRQVIDMPQGAEFLFVGHQGGEIMLWALVYPDAPIESRDIVILGTGHVVPDDVVKQCYIGSVQIQVDVRRQTVWHVFDATPEPF